MGIYKYCGGVCNHFSPSFCRKLRVDVKLTQSWRVVPSYIHRMVTSLGDVKGKARFQMFLPCRHPVKDFSDEVKVYLCDGV